MQYTFLSEAFFTDDVFSKGIKCTVLISKDTDEEGFPMNSLSLLALAGFMLAIGFALRNDGDEENNIETNEAADDLKAEYAERYNVKNSVK